MRFTVRPATPSDALSIARVHVTSWRSTYGGIVPEAYLDSLEESAFTSRWEQWIHENKVPILAAEDDLGVFGFISGGPNREPEMNGIYGGELYAIYLLQNYQGRGVGRALVRALTAVLRDRGHRGMLVWLLEANPAAGFYRHLGAISVSSRSIEIGGAVLSEIALGWPDIDVLA